MLNNTVLKLSISLNVCTHTILCCSERENCVFFFSGHGQCQCQLYIYTASNLTKYFEFTPDFSDGASNVAPCRKKSIWGLWRICGDSCTCSCEITAAAACHVIRSIWLNLQSQSNHSESLQMVQSVRSSLYQSRSKPARKTKKPGGVFQLLKLFKKSSRSIIVRIRVVSSSYNNEVASYKYRASQTEVFCRLSCQFLLVSKDAP